MYSIKTNSSYNPASRSKILKKNFFASSESSKDNLLHFSYRLVDLQKEIEKRTFYLGKNRSAEGAQHLLDLIGMSRDEGDVLYPFAKAAMADVYDALNVSTAHISKRYEWLDEHNPIVINHPIPTLDPGIRETTMSKKSSDKLEIFLYGFINDNGLMGGGTIDYNNYDLSLEIEFDANIMYTVLETSTAISTVKTIRCLIPREYLKYDSATSRWILLDFKLPIPLDKQSDLTSKEIIDSITRPTILDQKLLLKNPQYIPVGTVITVGSIDYEIVEDTNENDLDLTKHAIQVDSSEMLVEGIHYYLAVPNFINLTSVEPLDNAIMEALVNRIIWKWLVLSYPAEAATYDQMYQDTLKSIVTRCNIFNKHWRQVPRIL